MSKYKKLNGVLKTETLDSRNYKIGQFVPNVDKIKDTQFILKFPEKDIILNQNEYNACVGFSFVLAKQILEYQHTNKWIEFDPFMVYGTRKDNEYQGIGMYATQAASVLLHEGVFFKRDFGIEDEMPNLMNSVKIWKKDHPEEVENAKKYTITGYSHVYTTNEIKIALKNKMPVCAMWPIYDSFYNVDDTGLVPIPDTNNEEQYGYHQMCIVGWTNNNWIVANSWGNYNGFKGMYLIPFDFKFNEAIAVSDTITPSKYKAKEIILSIGKKEYCVDGINKEFDVIPYLKNNRSYLPIRFITECLGCSVEWIPNSKEVIVRSEEAIIKLQINSNRISIDDKFKYLDCAPEIVDNRTMIPIRFISEALNCKVDWDNGKVLIKAL